MADKEEETPMDTMKAIRMRAYGGPEVLVYEDIAVHQVSAGDVLVRVHAAGVNPVGWKIRSGFGKEWGETDFRSHGR
jgi:NADPH:quinone reductase-like Zn-dependent oxidoreductase